MILSFLCNSTKLNVIPFVCKRWNQLCYELPIKLDIREFKMSVYDIFATLEHCEMRYKYVDSLVFDTKSIMNLGEFPLNTRFEQITRLSYIGNKVDYPHLEIITELFKYFSSGLTSIMIENSNINHTNIEKILSTNKKITSVCLWQINLLFPEMTSLIERGVFSSVKKLKYNHRLFKKKIEGTENHPNLFCIAISQHWSHIEHLDLRHTRLKVGGLMYLSECKNLKYLNVTGSDRLKSDNIEDLQKQLKDVTIDFKINFSM